MMLFSTTLEEVPESHGFARAGDGDRAQFSRWALLQSGR
jgi:hypothetical protein